MCSVDTNGLVRLITRDDARQTAVAHGFVAPGAGVSTLALAEAMWVMELVALSRKAGHLPLGTLERSLAKIDGAQQL